MARTALAIRITPFYYAFRIGWTVTAAIHLRRTAVQDVLFNSGTVQIGLVVADTYILNAS